MEIDVILGSSWGLFAVAGAFFGSQKQEPVASFLLSLFLGPIGLLFVLASSGKGKACPFCKELVRRDAEVCKHCHRDIPALPPISQSESAARTARR